MSRRQRLDAELVRRQLVVSRREAAELIESGRVLVNGAMASKVAHQVDPSDALLVSGPPARFVSRGGEKLDGALEGYGIDVTGRRVLDAGASTGGFSDCLLQRGAGHVIALDVGHGQLHPKIRDDERVTVFERFNVRDMTADDIGGRVTCVVADLSFISLTLVVPALVGVCEIGSDLVLLVKPQFEVGRREVSKGRGIISDPDLHEAACLAVRESCEQAGAQVHGVMLSPLTGAEGNKEFLLHATVRAKMSA
ncbi:MAG: TlyA family RNA methyltransferase [Ilumatobacteraceae bacterium]|nr:TlyA family RNA methyltransferase [Ilumatobacteraceae bacterium]